MYTWVQFLLRSKDRVGFLGLELKMVCGMCLESKLATLEEHQVLVDPQPFPQPHKETFLSQNEEPGHRKL